MKKVWTIILCALLVAVATDGARAQWASTEPAESSESSSGTDVAAGQGTADDEACAEPEACEGEGAAPESPRAGIPYLLPEDFKVYVRGDAFINHPAAGFKARVLPTVNHYQGKDGGYVAIYSKVKKGSVYGVGGGIYVMGQVRVKGGYVGRIFYPEGYAEGEDITNDPAILKICAKHFPGLKGKMWIGGDTGGWFGIQ